MNKNNKYNNNDGDNNTNRNNNQHTNPIIPPLEYRFARFDVIWERNINSMMEM